MQNVKVARTWHHDFPLPKQQSQFAAGFDLQFLPEDMLAVQIYPGERILLPTGYAFEIPARCAGFIWPRSGLAVRNGIMVMAGLIDSDYRGEVKVCVYNAGQMGEGAIRLHPGDRIAQLVISPVHHGAVELEQSLNESTRGLGGFGSTGR